ncbi:MAG TPA: SPFH domain-containing protein, partial [Candidatus Polarisedimenticolia bacterium]|nr:SPFH domain-containing protein [Candidatus Polarisedimenticolia bacterium]
MERPPQDIYMARARHWLPRAAGTLVLLAVALIAALTSVAYVPAGHVGVLTLFGRVTGEILPEGTHLISPFKTNNRLAVRTQELKETASVPSEEGLIVTLDTSLLFRLDASKAAEAYQKIG